MSVLSRRMQRRLLVHHPLIAAVSGLLLYTAFRLVSSDHLVFRLSMATAYVALLLLAVTLLIGPWKAWRGGAAPLGNHDLRRDIGIWAGLVGLAHVVFGLQVHLGSMLLYFVQRVGPDRTLVPRLDAMGVANYTGLVATLVLVLLLALSNDWSLRRLGVKRWKRWQRSNWIGFGVIAVHGVIYQLLEKRGMPYPVVFGALLLVVVAGRQAAARARATEGGQ